MQHAPQRVHSKRSLRRLAAWTMGSFTRETYSAFRLTGSIARADVARALNATHLDSSAVAGRPAYTFLILVIGLHFTVGSALQIANPAFGVSFGELFFFAGLTWIFTRGQNFEPAGFLALRPPSGPTLFASAGVAIAGFFFAGALNAVNRWIVGPEIASRYDITPIFDVRSPFEAAFLVLGIAVLAPLGEELVFRGYLQRVLGARYGTMRAVIVTSVLFAAIHLNPASLLALFALGVVFALLRVWTGSIWPAILAHAMQNGTSSALVLAGVAEESPDEMEIGAALLLLAITTPLLFLAMRHLRGLPAMPEPEVKAIDPAEGHRLAPHRIVKPLLVLIAAAIVSILALVLVDGEAVRDRLQRATGTSTPAPMPAPESPELPLPETG